MEKLSSLLTSAHELMGPDLSEIDIDWLAIELGKSYDEAEKSGALSDF